MQASNKLRNLRNVNNATKQMKALNNPFIIYGYKGPDYFCDRKEETEKIVNALHNERNITLIAPRRIGKTGLIQHVFNQVRQSDKQAKCFYIDIYATKNLQQMVQLMARNIIGQLDTSSQTALRRIQEFFSSLRPTVSFDQLTGLPTVSLDIKPTEEGYTLKRIFEYMQQSDYRCYVAFDEFQQILNYSDTGIEATLRSYIQFLPNIYFIFSGSVMHMMETMFTSVNRPFFQSSQIMVLDSVPQDEYRSFANRFFRLQEREISKEVFAKLYDSVEGITWYVQSILNRTYQYAEEPITDDLIQQIILELVQEQEAVFQNYYTALPETQALLIEAIAKEGSVKSPHAHDFISHYHLKAPSSVRTALNALIDKQMIYKDNDVYIVYDRFFNMWLKRK